MTTIFDVPTDVLLERVAEKLKKMPEIKQPEWAYYVKTGVSRERRPSNPEWWHIRAASILRKIYIHGPIGTEKLRNMYGGRKNNGSKPEHFRKGGGKIIRVILQHLESAGLVKHVEREDGVKGRVLTDKGRSLLDKTAFEVKKTLEKTIPTLKKYT